MKTDYDGMLQIDHNALDVECLEQPGSFMRISQAAAQSNAELDRAKESLDVMKAEISKKIRLNPEKYGIEKLTEAQVECAVISEPSYRDAQQKLIDLREQANILGGAVRAFDQRKKMLELLVSLYGQQYFAGPKMPRDLNLEVAKDSLRRKAFDKMKAHKETPSVSRRTCHD